MLDGNAAGVGKCLWCGQPRVDLCVLERRPEYSGVLTTLPSPIWVCPGHESELDAFLRKGARRSVWLLVAILLGLFVLLTGGITERGYLILAAMGIIGVAFVAFPFATPETVSRLGVARSARIIRSIGSMMVVVSAAAAVWTLVER